VIDAAFALEAASDPDAGKEHQGVIAHEMQHVWHVLSGDPTLPALIPADDPRFAPEGRGDFADKREAYLAAVFEPEIVGEVHAHHQQILNGPEPEPGSELARLSDIIGEFAAGEIPPDRMEAAKALIADDPDFGYRETIRDDFGAMFDREYGLRGAVWG
jgi:hypothetical protein